METLAGDTIMDFRYQYDKAGNIILESRQASTL